MEDFNFLELWDIYNPLLTKTQREISNLYFNCDLSLAEIAEEKGCSRQSVSDCLQKCRKQLKGYEEKLQIFKKLTELSTAQELRLKEVSAWAERLSFTEREALQQILSKDRTEEVKKAMQENA